MKTLVAILMLASGALASERIEVECREVELTAFERHEENMLNLDKPLYRLGEIMKLGDVWVVPVNYWFDAGEWHYNVVEVKVGKSAKK